MTVEKSSSKLSSWQRQSWMASVDRELDISALTIPGTHDSGATHGGPGDAARCQTMSVRHQLDNGIRFLDIRCAIRGSGSSNYFEVVHGAVDQQLAFGGVLRQVDEFLRDNPSEVVLMKIKKEKDSDSGYAFNRIFWEIYVEEDGWSRLFYMSDDRVFPRVSEAAGKVLVFSDDITGVRSLGSFNKQDLFNVDLSAKKKAIKDHISAAIENQYSAFLNMLNIQFRNLHDPEHWAESINPFVRDYIKDDLIPRLISTDPLPRLGIIAMDYPENTSLVDDFGPHGYAGLVPYIIQWNFSKYQWHPTNPLPMPQVLKFIVTELDGDRVVQAHVEGTADSLVKQVEFSRHDDTGYSQPVDVVEGRWQKDFKSDDFKYGIPKLLSLRSAAYEDFDASWVVDKPISFSPLEITSPEQGSVIGWPTDGYVAVSGVSMLGAKVHIQSHHILWAQPIVYSIDVEQIDGTWEVDVHCLPGINLITATVLDQLTGGLPQVAARTFTVRIRSA